MSAVLTFTETLYLNKPGDPCFDPGQPQGTDIVLSGCFCPEVGVCVKDFCHSAGSSPIQPGPLVLRVSTNHQITRFPWRLHKCVDTSWWGGGSVSGRLERGRILYFICRQILFYTPSPWSTQTSSKFS